MTRAAKLAAGALGLGCALHAQAGADEDLARQLANPVPTVANVLLEFNRDSRIGPERAGRSSYLNVHPVLPIRLGQDWNVISKTYISIDHVSNQPPGSGSRTGIGHVVPAFFFSPRRMSDAGLRWGIGPIVLLPTNTEIGKNSWGLGPTGFAVVQSGPWTYGIVADHIEAISRRQGSPDISATFFQPFFSYTASALTYGVYPETIYDWSVREYSVPLNFVITKVSRLGDQPLQYGVGLRYWARNPDNLAHGWGVRLSIMLVYAH